jgi:putative sugar O-methyltransferase
MSSKLKVNYDIAQRLQAFICSELFAVRSRNAKTEYWKHHADQLHATIRKNFVSVDGNSGFYVPQKASALHRVAVKARKALCQPSKAVNWAVYQFMTCVSVPRLMSYEKAFDAVMSCADVADPDLSPFRVNHAKLAQCQKVFTSTVALKQHYQNWSGYAASDHIIGHYYYQNVLRGYISEGQIGTVMEIGAGNGNFPSIFYHDWAPIKVILVDLPETLAVAIPFLNSLFPKAKILMPHEVQSVGLSGTFDFAFLTVDQIEILDDNSIDLAINCHSFQEMTHEQIRVYFKLVQRVCRDTGFFFTANRVEKIPCGPDSFIVEQLDPPNRFGEYPWNPQNEKLVYEVSRLHRLVQLDDISIRLDRIRK